MKEKGIEKRSCSLGRGCGEGDPGVHCRCLPAATFVDLALCARSARSAGEFGRAALETYQRTLGFDTGVFSELGAVTPLATLDVGVDQLAVIEHCERNLTRYREEILPAIRLGRMHGGFVDTDVYSASVRSGSVFYAEVVRPQGVRCVLGLCPSFRGQRLGMFRLQRHGGPAFQNADLHAALELLPLIELGLAALGGGALREPCELGIELTPRERDIATYVARGLTTPEIARLLGTSRLTVRNQLGGLLRKVHVANRTELAAWFASRTEANRSDAQD